MANRLNVLVGATLEQNVEKKLNTELKVLEGKLNELSIKASFGGNVNQLISDIQKAISAIDFSKMATGANSAQNYIHGISRHFANVNKFIDKSNKSIVDFNGNLKSAKRTVQDLDGREITTSIKYDKDGKEIGQVVFSDKSDEKRRKSLRKTEDAYQSLAKTIRDVYSDTKLYDISIYSQKQQKELDTYKKKMLGLLPILNDQTATVEELERATKRLNAIQNNVASFNVGLKKKQTLKNTYQNKLNSLNEQFDLKSIKLKNSYGDLFDEEKLKRIYDITKKINNELKKTAPDFKKIDSLIDDINKDAKKFEAELAASAKEARRIQKELDILDSTLGRFVQFYGFGELFRAGKTAVTEMVSAVSTLDASLVELKKVTDETDSTYERFMDNAANSAKELGVSISDYIDSVTSFARSGFGFEDSQEIAKTANIMQMVSEDMSAEDASSYLISIIRGFNLEASKSIDIVNALNNVSNNFAITTDGLGDALQRSSASLKTAGNDLNESIALIATANETIQNPTSVGQGWKTISINCLVA